MNDADSTGGAGTQEAAVRPIRVLLVDDQPLLRMGFRMLLSAAENIEVVGEASDGHVALREVELRDPDVVLMDVRMPRMDGVEATRRLVAAGSRARVLVVTTFDLDEYAFAALGAGASGFVLKDVAPANLVGAIRAVASGDAVVSPRVTRHLLDRYAGDLAEPEAPEGTQPLAALTLREREVLLALADGLSNAEIAARLVLSEATVKTHVTRILTKLDLRDRVQAVVFAYRHRLL